MVIVNGMLLTSEPHSGPPSRTPSILDSPTLARVERARLRLEANASLADNSLERKILDPKVCTHLTIITFNFLKLFSVASK